LQLPHQAVRILFRECEQKFAFQFGDECAKIFFVLHLPHHCLRHAFLMQNQWSLEIRRTYPMQALCALRQFRIGFFLDAITAISIP